MEIFYRNKRIRKVCESSNEAIKKHGPNCAKILQKRMSELASAITLQDIAKLIVPGLHWLEGKRKHQCAIKLPDGKRLVFEPKENETRAFIEIEIIEIQEITDYH